MLDFNSIKVRLELRFLNDNSFLIANFNSIKVRLEHDIFDYLRFAYYYFNSIKVRLELAKTQAEARNSDISIP